jgi:hypothetical protein
MNYSEELTRQIRTRPPVFGKNIGIFYPIGGYIAKVFLKRPKEYATAEYNNLMLIRGLNDPRMIVPRPECVIETVSTGEIGRYLDDFGYHTHAEIENDEQGYATLMEHILFPTLDKLTFFRRIKYLPAIKSLYEAMAEHRIYKEDIKINELFALDASHIGFVDVPTLKMNFSDRELPFMNERLDEVINDLLWLKKD